MLFLGSSEIWDDKVSLLHINVTQRGGEHGGKSFGNKCFNKSCKSLLCNEVEQSKALKNGVRHLNCVIGFISLGA